jgi:hypothetical protein
MSQSQLRSFGRPKKDLGADAISTDHITSKMVSSIEHIDTNVVEIEKDIFDLQDIAFHNAEESIGTQQEIGSIQNDLVDLQYIQSLPWFCKSNFVHGVVNPGNWNVSSIPDSANQLFVRYINLPDTYTGMILILPRVTNIGEARHVSMHPKNSEACVYITTNPVNTIRLSSFDVEWLPPMNGSDSDNFISHGTLLAKPTKLGGFVFGSNAESTTEPGQCVVFPDSGAFYIQSMYLDNNGGFSKIVFIGQKFQATQSKNLNGFTFYGIQ